MCGRPAVAYRCDGSLAGILCCIYESYTQKELPVDVLPLEQTSLFIAKNIETVEEHALRVWRSIEKNADVALLVRDCWLADQSGREQLLFTFIRRFYELGKSVCARLDDPVCSSVFQSARALRNEAHLMSEFLRFSEREGVLVAEIEPKGMVLPLMRNHFVDRYMCERFIIFDRTHRHALFYGNRHSHFQEVDELELSPATEAELQFEALWKQYYRSIANLERLNPRCRMNHMPKRFWAHMLEVSGELSLRGSRTVPQLPNTRPALPDVIP